MTRSANGGPVIKERISERQLEVREQLLECLETAPIPPGEKLKNLPLFLRRPELEKILFVNEIYQQLVSVHGIIMEFGVRWGSNLALYEALRGIYEPYNHNRRIVGFDTFAGFPSVHPKDGDAEIAVPGAYGVTDQYPEFLEHVLGLREQENPKAFVRKTELVIGDACDTISDYLGRHPETIVAFAYFDFDLYEPTLRCLEAIRPHLTRGSILGFDELNLPDFPGETLALQETLGLDRYRITRSRFSGINSYLVID